MIEELRIMSRSQVKGLEVKVERSNYDYSKKERKEERRATLQDIPDI